MHDRSPIICTVPEPGDQQNFIVGKNLNQFLSLGYYCGYFGLEQLAFDLDGTLQAFTRSNRKQNLKTDIWAERSADPERAAVLQFLQKQMGLQPWDGGKKEFKSLQRSVGPLNIILSFTPFRVRWRDGSVPAQEPLQRLRILAVVNCSNRQAAFA